MAKGKKSKKGKKRQKEKSSDGKEEVRQEEFEEGLKEVGEEGQEVGEEIGQEVQGGRAEKIRQEGQRRQEPCKEEGGCPPTGCPCPQTGSTEACCAQAKACSADARSGSRARFIGTELGYSQSRAVMGTFDREFVEPLILGWRRRTIVDRPGSRGSRFKAAALAAAAFFVPEAWRGCCPVFLLPLK
jgi:hypothetical protein